MPFVPSGAGAATGLSPLEHVQWAKGLQPPEKFRKADLDQDLQAVLEWVTATSVEEWIAIGLACLPRFCGCRLSWSLSVLHGRRMPRKSSSF